MLQNYPNPFNPETTIQFELPQSGKAVITIFSMLGERIRTLADARYEAGNHSIVWDGKNENGKNVASGVYFYQMKTESNITVRKMILMR